MIGLEEIKKLIDENGDPGYIQNAFCEYNNIRIRYVKGDMAIVSLDVRKESCNYSDMVQGGCLFSMCDNVTAHACRTDGNWYVTLNADFHYIRNTGIGHTVYAVANIVHRGRTTCLVDAVCIDDEDKLLATGQFTYFRFDQLKTSTKKE